MHKLKSLDKYDSDIGMIYSVLIPDECIGVERDKIKQALGKEIEIDGNIYEIKGVERYACAMPIRKDEPIGILV